MNEFIQGITVALIPALAVSILTAYITVKLSMKQFYSQKWWEKKAEAYSHIIENLSYFQYFFDERLDAEFNMKHLSDEEEKKLSEKYKQTKEYIAKAAAIGAYIVSDKTAIALKELLHEFDKSYSEVDFISYLDRNNGLVRECIAKIKEYAKADLSKQ
jgi:uncharacterized membrane protein YkgB